ncbi:hypothetical protein OGAPHI_006227 [Ogataea philodendri]|uniref:Uncharacterized protein n=1 Tax=Ogataea philodendri TaxID=1378263 RepID=A0A9P8T1U2_9ASCO|nr:uncharacterized protein OGAPHI_006227 [Ogataea philodendri]KAH3662046.1 hypothetical protein OGAPHI_006227 [Ogataea philodendri]
MSSSTDFEKSPLEIEFEAEIRYCLSDMRTRTGPATKKVQGITLQTTLGELFELSDVQDVIELVIENEHSSKNLDNSLPLYHILECGSNLTHDQVPTMISISVVLPGSVARVKQYVVTLKDELGREVEVELTSQDCIIVDNTQIGYDSYVLLSTTGRQKISAVAPLNTEFEVKENTHMDRNWVATVSGVARSLSLLPLRLPELVARGTVHFFEQGTFWRLLNLTWVIVRFSVIQLVIGVIPSGDARRPKSFIRGPLADIINVYLFGATIFGSELWISLEDIILNDFSGRAQKYSLIPVRRMLAVGTSVENYAHLKISLLVRSLIVNNRRGRLELPGKVHPEQKSCCASAEFYRYVCVAVQDFSLLLITLHPTIFQIYKTELDKHEQLVAKLRNDLAEQQDAIAEPQD